MSRTFREGFSFDFGKYPFSRSLDQDELPFEERSPDPTALYSYGEGKDPEELFAEFEICEKALQILSARYSERDLCFFLYYFGLCGEKKMTLAEIGRKFGVSRERVRQVVEKLLHDPHLKRFAAEKCGKR